jgi:hypothetical protein
MASKKKEEQVVQEKQYVVLFPFVGNLTRGDVVSESALGSDASAMVAEGSIRKATAAEIKAGWVKHPDGAPTETETEAKEEAGAGDEPAPANIE